MNKTELHRHLCVLMLQVQRDKDIQPVVRLIESLGSAKVRLDIVKWVQRYSPFVFRERAGGRLSARMSKTGKFSLDAARENSFWRTETANIIATDTTTKSSTPKLKKDAGQRLQLQSQKEILKTLKEFFVSPHENQFGSLIEQLEQYKKYSVTVAGVERESRSRLPYVVVVQGGLPSLGKRAK